MGVTATVPAKAALGRIAGVEGWLTDAQARVLFEAARAVPDGGTIVEIGSYRGRSAIVLALGAGGRARVVAIDPHAGTDVAPEHLDAAHGGGSADHDAFVANLRRAGVEEAVTHVRRFSHEAHEAVDGAFEVVYVDGAHRYAPARDDVASWGARVRPGGRLLIHDAFSSIGVTLAILRLLTFGRRFAYRGRTGSLASYARTELSGRTRVANAARQLAELPWFARNVLVKVAIVTRLRGLARLLGHRSDVFPY